MKEFIILPVLRKIIFVLLLNALFFNNVFAQYQMEKLDRGVVAVRTGNNNFVSWRWLGTEPDNITFNVYRNGTKVNAAPLMVCNYSDNGAPATASYIVRAIVGGAEQAASAAVTPWAQQYLRVGIQAPASGYVANDASIADLDGDGQWEIILKWDPANAQDNSKAGVTGNVYIDAYKLNGTRLWRVNLGRNIRAGAHYTQFQVYDFNSDGKAEMMCKTADGTVDGKGVVIGNANADYRNGDGYILSGPEFLTVFNGETGAAMATVNYTPGRGSVSAWGDGYGNRVDRFRAGVAYLDGKKPSAIFCRGYYTRMVIAAWDWNGSVLSSRWVFDSGNSSSNPFYGQGNHSLSIADVDNDGKQEIISGAAIIDDNGTGYYSTGFGHGDAGHVSDLDPSLPGLEVFNIQERFDKQGCYMYSALDKKVLWTKPSVAAGADGEGPGRGVCADISAAYPGAESWVAGAGITGVFDCKGNRTNLATPASCNFLAWWDGDPLRELLNGTTIDKYGSGRLLTANNIVSVASNNGSKSTPALSGDFFGDWREEVIWRSSANDALYIFTTTIPSNMKLRTLMHDPQYRTAIAWQNTAYNQPPHVSYFIGDGMVTPPAPNITIVGGTTTGCVPTITAPLTSFCAGGSVVLTASAGTSYKWFDGTTQVGTAATYTATTAGSYTVEVTTATGCKATSTPITITVNPLPVITQYAKIDGGAWTDAATATACDGSTVNLGPHPNFTAGWSWTGPNNFTSSLRDPVLTSISASKAGTYTATYTDANGCKATSSFTLQVASQPTATITSAATSFCAGESVTLTTSTGSSYKWFNGTTQVGTDATYVASTGGAYTVEVTNAAGCKAASAVKQITANPLPTAAITSPAASFCAGGSVTLTSNAGSSYKWFNGTTQVGTDATYVAKTAGAYTVEVTNAAGCKATSAVKQITVNPLPTAAITAPATSFCTGESITLNASAGSSYKWFKGTTQVGTDATYVASTAGDYTVEITNANGCKATSAVKQITSNPLPTAIITSSVTSFCAGGSATLTSSAGSSYKWFNGTNQVETDATYTAYAAGAYTVEVTNTAGCKATSAIAQITVTSTVTWYQDSDNDGKGDPSSTLNACSKPSGYVATAGDACPADANKTAAGGCGCGNLEIDTDSDGTPDCVDSDDDNDGIADASDCTPLNAATGAQTIWYQDTDGDGMGDIANTLNDCTKPSGYVATAGDACPTDANKTTAGNCGCGNTEASCLDCAGVPNGDAFLDNCSICAGGTTGNTACVTTATLNGTSINIKVIPQPFDAHTTITVENYGMIDSYTIISASGALVETQQGLHATEITLGETLASGLYTVIITTEKGTYTTKIVKK